MPTKLEGLNPDFRELLVILSDEHVDFMVVGAYALAVHGILRTTGDIDVFVKPDLDNARRLFRALESFGAPLDSAGVKAEDFATPGLVYQIGLPPRRIDILTNISGVSFDDAARATTALPLEAHAIRFIGRADLIKNKRAAARPKDLLDADLLEKQKL